MITKEKIETLKTLADNVGCQYFTVNTPLFEVMDRQSPSDQDSLRMRLQCPKHNKPHDLILSRFDEVELASPDELLETIRRKIDEACKFSG